MVLLADAAAAVYTNPEEGQRPRRKAAPTKHDIAAKKRSKVENVSRAADTLQAAQAGNGGRLQRGQLQRILEGYTNVSSDDVYNEIKKRKKTSSSSANAEPSPAKRQCVAQAVDCSPQPLLMSTVPPNPQKGERNKGGRPKGSTAAAVKQHKQNLEAAKVWATRQLISLQTQAANESTAWEKRRAIAKGSLKEIIKKAIVQFDLGDGAYLSEKLIRKRAERGNPAPPLPGGGQTSPMLSIESKLVELCIALERVHNSPLTAREFLGIVNALIRHTNVETAVIEWKVRHTGYTPDPNNPRANLGTRYYRRFIRRHQEVLAERPFRYFFDPGTPIATRRETAKEYYDKIFKCVDDAGVARRFSRDQWVEALVDNQDTREGQG